MRLIGWLVASLGMLQSAAASERILLGGPPSAIAQALSAEGLRPERCFRRVDICTARAHADDALIERLSHHQGVWFVERDQRVTQTSTVPETGDLAGTSECPSLWELNAMGAPEAWELAFGFNAPAVAIADNGFYLGHADMSGRTFDQYDYADNDPIAEPELDVGIPHHGTFIAGLIGAAPNNGVGRIGAAPAAPLVLLKIADYTGAFFISYVVAAIDGVLASFPDVRVVSYSLTASYSQALEQAVDRLGDADILLVASAGNCSNVLCLNGNNDLFPVYPANFVAEHVVSVAGTLSTGALDAWSHFGASSVDIAAPGNSICSLDLSSTQTASGTSYAAPLVAAAAALVWEAHPDVTAIEVARVLRASASPSAALEGLVAADGALDAGSAVRTAIPRLSVPSEATVVLGEPLEVLVDNVGAAGQAALLLYHASALTVTADGWTATAFSPGDVLALPDLAQGTFANGTGTVLRRSLLAHESRVVKLVVDGPLGTHDLSARLTVSSAGADYLNAPYQEGAFDPSGFRAYASSLTLVDAPESDGAPSDDDGAPLDPEDGDGEPFGDADFTSDGDTKPARNRGADGGCAQTPAGLVAVMLLLLLRARRAA